MQDDTLQGLRSEVQQLLGKCLLALQHYERVIKHLVAHQEISASIASFETALAAQKDKASRKTLGTLMGELTSSYLTTDEVDPAVSESDGSPEDETSFSFRTRCHMSQASYDQTVEGLKELVQLRNMLVHHFLEKYSLETVDECRRARDDLADHRQLILRHIDQVQDWARDMVAIGQMFERQMRKL